MKIKQVYLTSEFCSSEAFEDYIDVFAEYYKMPQLGLSAFVNYLTQENNKYKLPALALYNGEKIIAGIAYKTLIGKDKKTYLWITHQFSLPEYHNTIYIGRFLLEFIKLAENLPIYFTPDKSTKFYKNHPEYFKPIAEYR